MQLTGYVWNKIAFRGNCKSRAGLDISGPSPGLDHFPDLDHIPGLGHKMMDGCSMPSVQCSVHIQSCPSQDVRLSKLLRAIGVGPPDSTRISERYDPTEVPIMNGGVQNSLSLKQINFAEILFSPMLRSPLPEHQKVSRLKNQYRWKPTHFVRTLGFGMREVQQHFKKIVK